MSDRLNPLVTHARRSDFYRELYAGLRGPVSSLGELPVVTQASYWDSYRADPKGVLCTEHRDGLMLSSGGTTGAPKRTHVSNTEWQRIAIAGSQALLSAGLELGDRVANLCSAGDLATSMLFIHASLLMAPVPLMELSLSNTLPPADLAARALELRADALVGTPSVMLRVLEAYAKLPGARAGPLRKVLFLGEMLSEEQAEQMRRWVPGLHIRSAGHSMVDIGLVGLADDSCALGEHRETSQSVELEIVDPETKIAIEEPGRPGELLVTSFVRRLQPMLRYQVGDLAMWTEPPRRGRKYRLVGRSPAFWSLSNGSYSYDDVARVIDEVGARRVAMQLHVSKRGDQDRLVIKLALADPEQGSDALSSAIVETLRRRFKWLAHDIDTHIVAPVEVQWCAPEDMAISARAGKTLPVVDTR